MVRPRRRLLPQLPREIDQVESRLLLLFRDLAAGREEWPLLLFGSVGTGKTRAALVLADRAETASYFTVDTLCDLVVSGGAGPAWWEILEGKELAILDELGCRQSVGDLHYASVKKFLDTRELAGRRSILIANQSPDELRLLYDDRICSRALCGTWFELKGPDRRFAI